MCNMAVIHTGFYLYNADIFLYEPKRTNGFVQFEISINGLVCS